MATNALNSVIRHLRTAALVDGTARADGELLEAYVNRRDEAAFAALLRRHGAMVLGVCRRVLGNEADAEDAFQATFLVLVRKAASIRARGQVSNWLYGVAHNTALKAKAMNSKRRQKERQAATAPKPEAAGDVWRELQPLLDLELSLLPDKYRVPILLCDLEGQTIKEASRHLRWSQGTTATRLTRGRALLARRLLRRHRLAVSGGFLTTALSQTVANGRVPPTLALATLRAAHHLATGATAGLIPGRVALLMEGVLKTMLLGKLKIAGVAMLLAGALCVGISGLSRQTLAADPAPKKTPSSRPSPEEGNLKETVLALEKRTWEAYSKQDVNTFKSLLADDYVGMDMLGKTYDKAGTLDYVSKFRVIEHELTDARVVLLNSTSAIVTYQIRYRVRPTQDGEAQSTTRRATAAWAQRRGRWWQIYFADALASTGHAASEADLIKKLEQLWKSPGSPDKQTGDWPKLKALVKAQLAEVNAALLKGEYGTVVDATHPRLVAKEGGRDKMIATMKKVMDDLKSSGFTPRSFTAAEPTRVLATPKAMFVVVPTATELAGPWGKVTCRSVVVAISADQGQTWTFVNNAAAVKKHLPDLLPDTLKLPEVPTFSQLEANVDALKDRVAWSERMHKAGYLAEQEVQAAYVRLWNATLGATAGWWFATPPSQRP